MLYPVMPESTTEIYRQLGLSGSPREANPLELKWAGLEEGTRIGEVKPLFPRIDKVKTLESIGRDAKPSGAHATEAEAVAGSKSSIDTTPTPPMQRATEADAAPEGVTTFIEIGDFTKVDLRVGQVVSAERLPKSDKLLLMKIDIGESEPRQILAGIAEYYEPEKLIGRKVVVVANLKPRKLRGHESQGMVVAASVGDQGRPVIATFTEDVPNGARLK
jgi:methionyl-tRNA synthetase